MLYCESFKKNTMRKKHIITLFLIPLIIIPYCSATQSLDTAIQKLIKQGDKYCDEKDYPKAIECYKKATEVFNISPKQNRLTLSQIYNNFGITLLHIKEYDQVDLLYKEARRIRKQLLQKNPNNKVLSEALGKSHHNVGILEMETNKLSYAIQSFKAALKTTWGNNEESKDTCYYLNKAIKKSRKHSSKKKVNKRRDCPYCFKVFRVPVELQDHLPIHTKKKDFKCPYCPKKFGAKNRVKQHLYAHSGERSFICAVCKKGFIQQSKMEKHQYETHVRQHISISLQQ